MAASILTWWLVIQALSLVGLPLATFIFRALPDHGYAFAKSLGLLAVGYIAWLLAMLGIGSFSAPLVLLVAAVLGGSGWYFARNSRLLAFLRTRWRLVLGYEALFLAALVLMALVRATELPGITSPDPHGTERPMDFAFFNTIQRSPQFPPLDPWLSGYSINYYYFGYLLMACVALLSGLQPGIAYNLALSLIFALTALGIAGLVWNMIALTTKDRRPQTADDDDLDAGGGQQPIVHRLSSVVTALAVAFGIAAVLILGNFAGATQTLLGDERSVALNTTQMLSAMQQAVRGAPTIALPTPLNTDEWPGDGQPDAITGWERKPAEQSFSSWWSSRALWDNRAEFRRYAITEFPAFSFMLGDMHPHLLALPFTLLALALALTTIARPSAPFYAAGRVGWADLLLSGLIIGCLYVINSWDLPSYSLLFAGAFTLLYARLADGLRALPWMFLLRQLLFVGLASLLLFAPFHLTFRSFAGAEPTTQIPLLRTLTGTIGVVTARSELLPFLLIFATTLVPIAWFMLAQHREPVAAPPLGVVAQRQGFGEVFAPERLLDAGPWVIAGALPLGWLLGFQLLFLLPLGLYAVGMALRNPQRSGVAFALLAGALGCFISFGTEVVYIRDVFEGWQPRFNTIFKFYYQVWLIWGVIAAFGTWWLYTQRFQLRRPGGYLLGLVLLLLIASAAVYPRMMGWRALSEGERVGLLGRTARERTPAGAEAIRWLWQNAPNGAVVLEAVGPSYDIYGEGAGQVSAASGLPTVLGWAGHEGQWRNGNPELLEQLKQREGDIERIYSTLDENEARTLLTQYKVRYVYVGSFERSKYSPESLPKFERIAAAVFQQDDVTIYELP